MFVIAVPHVTTRLTDSVGIHVALFLSSLRPVFKRSRWLGAYSLALTVLATAGIILQTYWYSVAFLDHLKDPGGPYAFLRENVRHPVNIALTVMYDPSSDQ